MTIAPTPPRGLMSPTEEMDQLLSGVPFPEVYEARPAPRGKRPRIRSQHRDKQPRNSRWWIAELVIGLTVGGVVIAVLGAAFTGHDPSYGAFGRLGLTGQSASPSSSLKVTTFADKVSRPGGGAYRAIAPWKLKPGTSTQADILVANNGSRTIKVDITTALTGPPDQLAGLSGRVLEGRPTAHQVTIYEGSAERMRATDIELAPGQSRMVTVQLELSPTAAEIDRKDVKLPIAATAKDGGFHVRDLLP